MHRMKNNRRKFIIKRTTLLNKSGGAIVILDTFTGADGVYIESHPPNIAPGSPTGWDTSVANKYELLSNECAPNDVANMRATLESNLPNGTITAKFRIINSTSYAYHQIVFRFQDASNHWLCRLTAGGGITQSFRIIEITGGSTNIRASQNPTIPPADGAQCTFSLTFNGANIAAQLNSETPISYNLAATVLDKTIHGFQLRPYGTVTDFPTVDDFQLVTV